VDQSATASTTAVNAPGERALGASVVDEQLLATPQGYGYGADVEALRARALAAGTAALRELEASGIATVLDTTTIECGRDAELLRALDEATGVRVLVSTGLSSEEAGVSRAFRALSAIRLADVYIAELAEALPGRALRAAAVVVETGAAGGDFDETALLAAAFAHAETGAPLLVRAPPDRLPAVVDRLTSRGVEPGRLLALDLDRPGTSFELAAALGGRGVLLGITAIGEESGLDPVARAALAAYLLRAFGPARVCFGTGAVVTSPDGGSSGVDPLRRFREHVGAFGGRELLDEALSAGARQLLEGAGG
jgi:predicted metal-dependent phosphotriesterase family hydrolase